MIYEPGGTKSGQTDHRLTSQPKLNAPKRRWQERANQYSIWNTRCTHGCALTGANSYISSNGASCKYWTYAFAKFTTESVLDGVLL